MIPLSPCAGSAIAGYVDFNVAGKVLPFRLTLVLVEEGGRWLIAQRHASPKGGPAG